MKKRRPKNRPVKPRVLREKQAAAIAERDSLYARLASLERVMEALVEAVGRENVRRASAKLGSARSLAALAGHVANGKLYEVQMITRPRTVAVEISEHGSDGSVITESVVAELGAIDPEHAVKLDGRSVGDMVEFTSAGKVQVRRVWDTVSP